MAWEEGWGQGATPPINSSIAVPAYPPTRLSNPCLSHPCFALPAFGGREAAIRALAARGFCALTARFLASLCRAHYSSVGNMMLLKMLRLRGQLPSRLKKRLGFEDSVPQG